MTFITCAFHPFQHGLRVRSRRRGVSLLLFTILIPISAVFFMIALGQIQQQRMALAQRENRAQLRALALSALTAWEARTAGRPIQEAMAALPMEGALSDGGAYRIEAIDDPASPFTVRAVGERTVTLGAREYETRCEILARPARAEGGGGEGDSEGEGDGGAPTLELSMPRYGVELVEIDLSEPPPRQGTTPTLPNGAFPEDYMGGIFPGDYPEGMDAPGMYYPGSD